MTAERIHHLARRLAAARERANDAKRYGDHDGWRYARAEVARLSRILSEGSN